MASINRKTLISSIKKTTLKVIDDWVSQYENQQELESSINRKLDELLDELILSTLGIEREYNGQYRVVKRSESMLYDKLRAASATLIDQWVASNFPAGVLAHHDPKVHAMAKREFMSIYKSRLRESLYDLATERAEKDAEKLFPELSKEVQSLFNK